jgi:hypothetical protein
VGYRDASIPHQQGQQLEFCGRQMNQVSRFSHEVTPQVHFEISHLNECRFGCTVDIVPAKYGSHPGYELAKADGLGDIVVGAGLQSPHHVVLGLSNSHHQDPDFGRECAYLTASFHASDSRHIDVEEHQIKRVVGKDINGFLPAARLFDNKAVGSQRSTKHFTQGWLVIDD